MIEPDSLFGGEPIPVVTDITLLDERPFEIQDP